MGWFVCGGGIMRIGGPNGIQIDGHVVRHQGLELASGDGSPGSERGVSDTGRFVRELAPLASWALRGISVLALGGSGAVGATVVFLHGPTLLVLPAAALLGVAIVAAAIRRYLVPTAVARATEVALLRAADARHGSLTAPEAAMALSCSVDDAEAALESLSKRGYADAEVDQSNGILRYKFRGIRSYP